MLTQPVILLLPPHLTFGAWIAFAFLAGSGTLGFPALTASYPPALTGRVNTALNFVVFIAAFLAQWAVGVVVELLVPSIGTEAAYATAIAALIVIQVATLAWFITDLRRP
jgi:hypothetical protein